MHTLDLSLSDISKIEGKATCDITVREGKTTNVKFTIAEFKRFYTQALKGKDVTSVPQLTARICGTCSNAHLLCAAKAAEDAMGIIVTPQTILLRKLLNYGLIIRDHALHLYVFVMPDLLGKDSILDFDENDSTQHKFLDDTFTVKKAGNNLSKAVGGRSVHAPFVSVGGFSRLPKKEDLLVCRNELVSIRQNVIDLVEFFSTHDQSFIRDDIDFAGLCDEEYSFLYGDLIRSDGSKIPSKQYGEFLTHRVIEYSQASGYLFGGRTYMVGALARMNVGKEHLHPNTKQSLSSHISRFPSHDIFHNNLAQAIEILHAIDSSVSIIDSIQIVPEVPIPPIKKRGEGIGVIEAPRGALFYKLTVNEQGKVEKGQIVVPTGQNQICIEQSIQQYLDKHIQEFDTREQVELQIERIVRAYDPCMSCASHFLKMRWIEK